MLRDFSQIDAKLLAMQVGGANGWGIHHAIASIEKRALTNEGPSARQGQISCARII
jgi:hypothetical protein